MSGICVKIKAYKGERLAMYEWTEKGIYEAMDVNWIMELLIITVCML